MQSPIIQLTLFIGLLLVCLTLAACTPNGIYHTVQPGQTLYRIARTYDVDETELARINHIRNPRLLKAGQRLYIPGVSQRKQVASTRKSAAVTSTTRTSAATSKSSSATPKTTTRQSSVSTPSQTTIKSPPSKTMTSSSVATKPVKGLFTWPVKGKVLNGFGDKGNTTHKGIEIAASNGSPVMAAASGKVIYSGNAIRGYGNLIILEHSDNYFTVYGYNQKNLVAMDDFVGQGDRIALSGSPPNGKSPRLHFEIRHGKAAVDPIFYLP